MLNKKQKIFFFFLLCLFFIFSANFVLAIEFRAPEINYPYLPFRGVDPPQVFLEKIEKGEEALPLYVKYFYYLFLMIAGLLALGIIIYGGFLYLISAGAPVKMIAAKDQITGGILGLVILLSSYLILATINPQLAIFRLPGLEKIEIEPIEIEKIEPRTPVYFQIPVGIIIENAVLNEEAQEKLDSAYLTAEAAVESAKELYELSKEIHFLVMDADCGNSICRVVDSIDCSATGCTGKDYKSDIETKIEETALAIEDLEEKTNEISTAKIPLINDLFQLQAVKFLMSLALENEELSTYNDLSSIKYYFEKVGTEIKIDSDPFPDWENIDIKVNDRITKDPITFYLDRKGNEDVIYLASVLRWGGDAGFPPEPIGGWPEPPPPEPGKLGWPLPLAYFKCSSDFGACRPIGGCSRPHMGIDFSANLGTPVYAAADGTVVYKGYLGGYLGGYGKIVIIRHDNLKPPLSTAYAHLSEYYVKRGDRVAAGQPIAISGNTGYSTGPHLHFEVRNGLAEIGNYKTYTGLYPLDPKDYLPSSPSIKEDCYNSTRCYYPGCWK